ncbi:MAG: hypothetical protein SOR57_00675 [Parabacteroides sp.]|nr:hypothetical protein [Parabacteroides sp.]
MKKIFILISVLAFSISAIAQKKNFSYKFYGFVRGDLFYNTRANMAPVDGNFYLFPLDRDMDDSGKDINASPNGSFYTFTTRLGLDVKGPRIGNAGSRAKVEVDFGGFSASNTLLRIRQAYVALDWEKTSLLIGQTWHPLFGRVVPDVLNLSTGAPFQPFNREPQITFECNTGNLDLLFSALWQLQYLSSGPEGPSENYMKNSCVPEIYAGFDFNSKDLIFGAGLHMISLKPRLYSTVTDNNGEQLRFKVNERMTAFSCEAHLDYKLNECRFAAKTLLASCLDHTALIGGYGISEIDPITGEQKYSPIRHSTSWLNFTYGNRWKAHFLAGYTKRLGSSKPLVSDIQYGMGLDIDQILSFNFAFSYNLPHWQIGLEYVPTTAWYGETDLSSGRIVGTHGITNHRILGLVMYYF